ncbi:zinc finger protein 142-like [Anoplophora glabripennis]|uniref:zinc finger protein 142-like n=1 Tax=Anoplophora glabripennis TaxID=217634 RepID=UPI000C78E335|nr:zinc finger protein 142-like [Anoplophora glabripennis]
MCHLVTPLQSSNVVTFEESDCKNEEDRCKHENGSEVKTQQERKELYKCDKCIYETDSETCFTDHCARHENDLEAYKCESCDCETENEKLLPLQTQIDTPLQSSNIVPFEESDCKDKEEDGRKHENASKVKTKLELKVLYKCDDCNYETESESSFTVHCARHENDLEAYKCEYETENEKLLQRHLLRHKDPLCNDCDFESKYKSYIKVHELKHKDPSQVQMYKCNNCDYESKYKNAIKRHQLQHKKPFVLQDS